MSGPLSVNGAVLGVDVGFSSARRSSAVCRISWSPEQIDWEIARFRAVHPEREDTIVRIAGLDRLVAAAFDGPLRPGLDVIGRYRCAERMLTRRLRPLIGKPGQASAPIGQTLNAAANICAEIVLRRCDLAPAAHTVAIHEAAVVEAFPSSFLGVLIVDPSSLAARRADRSDTFYKHLTADGSLRRLVDHLLPGRRLRQDFEAVTNHDDRAALVCALTALCVAASDFIAVGDDDGWIVLPPPRFVQPWAKTALRSNAAEEVGTGIFASK